MASNLSAFQDGFAAALRAPQGREADDAAGLSRQAGFAVYRNTVLMACMDALQANYPTVVRLVGEQWFRAAAAIYAKQRKPDHPCLLYYGADFPEFLEQFAPAAELPYLPGVARLDRYWCESHAAFDEPSLASGMLAGLAPEEMAGLVLRPHAAARWRWFGEQPVYGIWHRNRIEGGAHGALAWQGQGALLTRPGAQVVWRELGAGSCALLDACAAGCSLAEAAAAAIAAEPDADIAGALYNLLEAGAFRAASLTVAGKDGS